ncbi:glycine-rich domain-containing protein [Microvirga alba]|uniref:Glycine-rich domain-containing protein n=1 Tax=Microvirga alba TaxID=2791025 RepID=A0A931FQ34_9HYPH|nr:hypothetical protein [Microvirga alba]MBF9235579.1 hypothetical protein [Microvirga alba]
MKLKQSAVAGKVPTTAQLALGELAINTTDGKLFMKKSVSGTESIVDLTAAASGVSSFNTRTGAVTLNSTDVNTAMAADTSAARMPVGTTAQRPATPAQGMFRMNSTTGMPEWWNASSSTWVPFSEASDYYEIEYLVVAGGGGGGSGASGSHYGGGGGAGGYLAGTARVQTGQSLGVTVGAGGAFTNSTNAAGSNGGNSVLGSLATAIGGGYGGSGGAIGGSGGSGGGGSLNATSGGSGTAGQGNAGGTYGAGGQGAGGGGASSAGASVTTGGSGTSNSITGSAVTYARGGDGNPAGTGGGTNTGFGGRGGRPVSGEFATSGASGIVVIRYIGGQRGSGGTVTQVGAYTVHTFTTSGTFTA